jgi:copper chaperone
MIKGGEIMSTTLHIEGMTCGHCKAYVEQALKAVPGVLDAAVDLTKHQAVITGTASRSSLVQAVEDAGYTVSQ